MLGGLATVFRADAYLQEIEALLKGIPTRDDVDISQPPFYDDVKAKADSKRRGDVLAGLSGYEFQTLVAAVLRAMGYVTKLEARGKDRQRRHSKPIAINSASKISNQGSK